MMNLLKIAMLSSFIFCQNVTLNLNEIVYPSADTNIVDMHIKITSDVELHSFNFVLDEISNILSVTSVDEPSLGTLFFESFTYSENYFYGGNIEQEALAPISDDPEDQIFMIIRSEYDAIHLDGQLLTIGGVREFDDQGIPYFTVHSNDNNTHFFTANGVEVTSTWIPMTWELGTTNIYSNVGQDCNGGVWGTAYVDDCGMCSGGDTGHDANSDQDCNGNCFGGLELDECGVCGGDNSSCEDECGVINGDNSTCVDQCGVPNGDDSSCQDCAGVVNGNSIIEVWYPDCDLDNYADSANYIEICGYPTGADVLVACGTSPMWDNDNLVNCDEIQDEACGLIQMDPGDHFDLILNCYSNSLDYCGLCDGSNDYIDCNGTCGPDSPVCQENENALECQGFYIGPTLTQINSGLALTDLDYGFDNCGVCGGDNSSCTGCTDENATNLDAGCEGECLFSDGSCTFELYPGDVNRDGIVDIQDIDGLGLFWLQEGGSRAYESIDWYIQYATDNWTDACAAYADTNGDGLVNHIDLSAILYNWGNTVDYQYYNGSNSDGPTLCYTDSVINDGDYRQNFEEILSFLELQSYDNDISRYMIEYISDLLGINFEPQSFAIYQNFPNPFNPVTKINFDIDLSSSVKLNIYNIRGQLVYEHNFGNLNPGFYSYDFDGSNLTSGVYMYNISTSKRVSPYKQMILVK